MSKPFENRYLHAKSLPLAAALCLSSVIPVLAQATAPPPLPAPQSSPKPGIQPPDKSKPGAAPAPETHITPDEAKQLFGLVDQLLKFSSQETGLPIKSQVKRQLTTRAAVEDYLKEKFN